MEVWRDELYHHGIKGQKWGVRRYQYDNGRYTEEGKERRRVGGSEKNLSKLNYIDTETQAMLIEVGAYAVVALSILAIKKGKDYVAKKNSRKEYEESINRKTGEVDPKTGFHLKTKTTPIEEDVKNVNPGANASVKETTHNCTNCALTVEMRQRGYDVTAKRKDDGLYELEYQKKYFPNAKRNVLIDESGWKMVPDESGTRFTLKFDKETEQEARDRLNYEVRKAAYGMNTDSAKMAINNLLKEQNSRGVLALQWGMGGGHVTSYEVKDGKVKIIEGQSGRVYSGANAEAYLANAWYISGYRLDNVELDYSNLKDVME